jgi:TamB, inner membrane protein subunit of TAM complex
VGRYVKDVNIDFGLDVKDDYSSGKSVRQTDLKIGLSKQMFHDRLSVYVGNTFALEGQSQHDNALSGLAGDVSAEYLLTPDGKFRLKGYRMTQHELAFQAQVVKTGVVFVVVLEFNKFKNAFKFNKKKKTA